MRIQSSYYIEGLGHYRALEAFDHPLDWRKRDDTRDTRARDVSRHHLRDQLESLTQILRFGPGPSLGSWGIGDHLPHTERTTPIHNGKPRTSSSVSDSPVSEHQPYAMPISIPAFLSCLLLIGSVRAWVNAPNCTDTNTFVWVGSVLSDAPFCIDNNLLFASC